MGGCSSRPSPTVSAAQATRVWARYRPRRARAAASASAPGVITAPSVGVGVPVICVPSMCETAFNGHSGTGCRPVRGADPTAEPRNPPHRRDVGRCLSSPPAWRAARIAGPAQEGRQHRLSHGLVLAARRGLLQAHPHQRPTSGCTCPHERRRQAPPLERGHRRPGKWTKSNSSSGERRLPWPGRRRLLAQRGLRQGGDLVHAEADFDAEHLEGCRCPLVRRIGPGDGGPCRSSRQGASPTRCSVDRSTDST